MNKITFRFAIVALLSFFVAPALSQAGALKGKLKGGDFAGYSVVALSKNGEVLKTAAVDSNNKFSLSGVSGNFTLQVIDSENAYAGPAVAICSKLMNIVGCPLKKTKLGVGFTGKNNLSFLSFAKNSDGFFKTTISNIQNLKRVKASMSARADDSKPKGTALNLGRGAGVGTRINTANPADGNQDGVPDVYSNDDDGDGTIDNYDNENDNPTSISVAAATADEVRVFSNLKLPIEQSLNANTGTVPTSSEIDTVLSTNGTLAIAVVGDAGAGDTTELDCGALSYCSTGGSGRAMNGGGVNFPGDFDADADGFGTVAAGGTGDFQLQHGATSSQIGGGDTFAEIVTDVASSETRVPGMVNFIFNTTPALKSLDVDGGGSYTVTYPTTSNMLGSTNNCFTVPATGPLSLTITAWRPQRPGNSILGEAAFVDIGKSRYTIDIPNAPCSGPGGCSGNGPGNCATSSMSSSDPNLTAATIGSGLMDLASDADADAANTFSFVIDLTACLGATSFSSGEKLFLDLQAVSAYGDNAAQKFCIQRS